MDGATEDSYRFQWIRRAAIVYKKEEPHGPSFFVDFHTSDCRRFQDTLKNQLQTGVFLTCPVPLRQ